MIGWGITILRKRIDYLIRTDILSFKESRYAYKPHEQVYNDKVEELERMEELLAKKLKQREDKKK